MKKIFEWVLILWISIPLMMEAVQVVVNLENYKIVVGWFTNVIYRKNTYYYIAAAIEVLIVLLIFIEVKRKWMLWVGLLLIVAWQIIKPIIIESDRAISYVHLKYSLSTLPYFSVLLVYSLIALFLFYKVYYKKAKI